MTWTLVDGGGAITCGDAGSDGVEVLATLAGTTSATADIFNCTDGSATTSEVPIGTHTVVVNVLDGQTSLGQSMPREESITFGNELVDLGNFEFSFQ